MSELLPDFLPNFLRELLDFLQVLTEILCQHAFLQLLQIVLQRCAQGHQFLNIVLHRLHSGSLEIKIAWRLRLHLDRVAIKAPVTDGLLGTARDDEKQQKDEH
jgi:hypothetical protein